MLLLAASLLFIPHYEVTRASQINISWITTDPNGNAYVASVAPATGAPIISKVDPDGNLVYAVSPMVNSGTITAGALDNAGNIYLALSVEPAAGGLVQGFVAKVDPTGKLLSTYRFPAWSANALAVGADGSIYLTGAASNSAWVQTTPGAWVPTKASGAFAIRLNPAGQVVYSTFLENTAVGSLTSGTAIAVDAAGNAYIGGSTADASFPTTNGAYLTNCCSTGATAAFLMKLNSAGTAPIYSTFLPGETPTSIAVDAAGNANLTIETAVSEVAISTAKLNPAGAQLTGLVVTQLGALLPNGLGPAYGFAVPDANGNILVTGQYLPPGFTVSAGACPTGTNFVAVLRAGDGAVLYSSRQPAGAGGSGIGPDGSGGFIVLGGDGPPMSTRPLALLTRFSTVSTLAPAIFGIANFAESAVGEGLAPGEIVSIYGSNLGPAVGVLGDFVDGALPVNLAGTEVLFNGIPGPLLWTANGQVNAIVPFELSRSQTVGVQVRADGVFSNTAQLPVLTAEPAILASAAGFALALNENGSINSQANPAQPGAVVTIFLNGGGLLTPTPADGALASAGPKAQATVEVATPVLNSYGTLSGKDTGVLYAGAAPGQVAGLMQVNFRLPSTSMENAQMGIVVTVGGLPSSATIWAK